MTTEDRELSISETHTGAKDAFAIVLLSGEIYMDLFPLYADAKKVADELGKPSQIIRYSVPTVRDGVYCNECLDLIRFRHAVKKLRNDHLEEVS